MSCAKVSWFWDFLSYFRRQNKYKIRDSWPRDINLKTLVGTLLPRLAVAVCWVLCYVPIFSFYCSRFLWWRQIRHYIHNTVCHYYPNLTHFSYFLSPGLTALKKELGPNRRWYFKIFLTTAFLLCDNRSESTDFKQRFGDYRRKTVQFCVPKCWNWSRHLGRGLWVYLIF